MTGDLLPTLIAIVVVGPLLAAAIALGATGRPRVARSAGLLGSGVQFLAATLLLVGVDRFGAVTVAVGGLDVRGAVTLTVDPLAAMLLATAGLVLFTVHVYAVVQQHTDEGWPRFHVAYLAMAAGVALAFTVSDLFTLFVAFELTLISSYVLLTFGGRPDQVRAGMIYTVTNVLAGLLLLTAIAAIYGATGTLSFAELRTAFPQLPGGTQLFLGALLVVPFLTKAAIFPLFSWLPDAYPTAPTPITAVFAALLTKLGIYAIARTHTTLGLDEFGPLLIAAATVTMVVGVLGALAQRDIKRILSFHAVSQVGYLLFGIALFDVAGLTATIVYLAHYIVVKTALFLVAASVEQREGTSRLASLRGLLRTSPVLAGLFVVSALSLVGLPPTSGFVAKLGIVQAGVAAGGLLAGVGVAVALVVSLGTLLSMLKIWNGAFIGEPREVPDEPVVDRRGDARVLWPTTALVAVGIGIAVAAAPVVELATRAAEALLSEPTPAVTVVVEAVGGSRP